MLGLLETRTVPLFILLTARTGESSSPYPGDHTLTLRPIAPDQASAIIEEVSHRPVSDELRGRLIERGGGVPLFLEELARAAEEEADEGAPARAGSSMPVTLAETITARLDRLGDAKRLAQMAAVMGSGFDAPTLTASAGVGEEEASRHLDALIDHGIVAPAAGSTVLVTTSATPWSRRPPTGRCCAGTDGGPRRGRRSPPGQGSRALAGRRRSLSISGWPKGSSRPRRRGVGRPGGGPIDPVQGGGRPSPGGAQLSPELPDSDQRDAIEVRVRGRLAQYIAAHDQAAAEVRPICKRPWSWRPAVNDGLRCRRRIDTGRPLPGLADYPAVHRALDLAEGPPGARGSNGSSRASAS